MNRRREYCSEHARDRSGCVLPMSRVVPIMLQDGDTPYDGKLQQRWLHDMQPVHAQSQKLSRELFPLITPTFCCTPMK